MVMQTACKEVNNKFLIKGKLLSKKDDIDLEVLTKLLGNNFNNHDIERVKLSSDNDFTLGFDLFVSDKSRLVTTDTFSAGSIIIIA